VCTSCMKLSTASCKNEYVRATLVITSMQLAVQVYMCIAAESMSNIYNNINIYKLSSIETRDGFLACVLYTRIYVRYANGMGRRQSNLSNGVNKQQL
jgi:hypothetical protein